MFKFLKRFMKEDPEITYLRNKVRTISLESDFRNNKISISLVKPKHGFPLKYYGIKQSTNCLETLYNSFECYQNTFVESGNVKSISLCINELVKNLTRVASVCRKEDIITMNNEEFEKWHIEYKESLIDILVYYKLCNMILEVRKDIIDDSIDKKDNMIFLKFVEQLRDGILREMNIHAKQKEIYFDLSFNEVEREYISRTIKHTKVMDDVILFSFNMNPILNSMKDKVEYYSMSINTYSVNFIYKVKETDKFLDYASGWINEAHEDENMYMISAIVLMTKYMEFESKESEAE